VDFVAIAGAVLKCAEDVAFVVVAPFSPFVRKLQRPAVSASGWVYIQS